MLAELWQKLFEVRRERSLESQMLVAKKHGIFANDNPGLRISASVSAGKNSQVTLLSSSGCISRNSTVDLGYCDLLPTSSIR